MGVFDVISRRKSKLLAAAREGDSSTLQSLLEQRVPPEVTDGEWMTPLHWAARRGGIEVARILVEHGANVSIKDKELYSPLQWACAVGNYEVAEFLLDNGAEFESGDAVEINPLIQAACGSPREEFVDIVALLLDRGANIHAKDRSGMTALFHATMKGKLETAEYLVEAGADLYHRDHNGWTLLHLAVSKGHAEVLQYFLERGMDANVLSWHGTRAPPLHFAAETGDQDMLEILLASGADRDLEASDGKTAAEWAHKMGHSGAARLLEGRGGSGQFPPFSSQPRYA
ncbi:MAG: hypothetical protein M1813_001322 [Trichoglossum hirsutum]|nr:MAG: hypothetical protein M1813_001322 [Trichoglossum hirsutum]